MKYGIISSYNTNITASMSGPNPGDPRPIAPGDDQQPSDDIAGSDDQEESEEPQPHHFDIVPPNSGGDVIWECKDKVSFLVSSAVLRLTSRYFKKTARRRVHGRPGSTIRNQSAENTFGRREPTCTTPYFLLTAPPARPRSRSKSRRSVQKSGCIRRS